MSFREDSLKYKEQFISQPNLVSETDTYFIKTYIKKENSENLPDKFSGSFNPGNIYLFRYSKSLSDKGDEFVSKVPLVLALDVFKKKEGLYFYGIDLITVPPYERAMILEKVYEYLGKNEGRSESLSSNIVKKLLTGTGYESACFSYVPQRISDIAKVSLSDWHKLPYLGFSLLEGSTQIEIYSKYRSKLK